MYKTEFKVVRHPVEARKRLLIKLSYTAGKKLKKILVLGEHYSRKVTRLDENRLQKPPDGYENFLELQNPFGIKTKKTLHVIKPLNDMDCWMLEQCLLAKMAPELLKNPPSP